MNESPASLIDSADLLLSFQLRPFPGGPISARTAAIIDTLERNGFPVGEPDPDADFEDFWEDAIRIQSTIDAAERAGLTWVPVDYHHVWTPEQLARRLGPVGHTETGKHAADPLEDHPLMLDESVTGRKITRCTLPDEDTENDSFPNAYDVLCGLYAEGHSRAVVKISGTKQGVMSILLSDDVDELRDELFRGDDAGWTMVRASGVPGGLLVAPWIEMTYEYRVFVVDGMPVTGAGCVEEFTPLDHCPYTGRFDSAVRKNRGNSVTGGIPSEVEYKARLVDKFVIRAHELAATLPEGRNTVDMDFAIVPGYDVPVLVELNGVSNAGLYAIDSDALADAMVVAKDRGYWTDEFLPAAFRSRKDVV